MATHYAYTTVQGGELGHGWCSCTDGDHRTFLLAAKKEFAMPRRSGKTNIGSIELESGTEVLPTLPAPNHSVLITPERRAVPMVTGSPDESERVGRLRGQCIAFLRMSREEMERATRTRRYYIHLGHRYGITNREIGEVLGISEAAVRALRQRTVKSGEFD